MSDASEIAALLSTVAAVRDRLGRRAFLRALARARVAVARAALEEAERGAGLRRGDDRVVPFARPSGGTRPTDTD